VPEQPPAGAEGSAIPVVDGHNDLPWAMREGSWYDFDAVDVTKPQPQLMTDVPRLREGCLGAQFWSVYVRASLAGDSAVTATLEQVDAVHELVRRYPETFEIARTADDVRRIVNAGRIASLLGMEGGHSINCSMGTLRAMYALGVRYMTLTHNDNVPWADSATDEPNLGGLNDFGRDVVAEMNRLGMLVDLSHTAVGTMRDALAVTTSPVIFSHSSARGLTDHVRNVPNDVLTALAGNGGVCMVTFVPPFVSTECQEWDQAVLADMDARGENRRDWAAHTAAETRRAKTDPPPLATIGQVADHIEHVRGVAGIEHVGIGGDFDGCDTMPQGLTDVSMYPALIAELLDRKWSEDEIGALTRGNVLRVLRDAEHVAETR
jgi:membrane dipeptidase